MKWKRKDVNERAWAMNCLHTRVCIYIKKTKSFKNPSLLLPVLIVDPLFCNWETKLKLNSFICIYKFHESNLTNQTLFFLLTPFLLYPLTCRKWKWKKIQPTNEWKLWTENKKKPDEILFKRKSTVKSRLTWIWMCFGALLFFLLTRLDSYRLLHTLLTPDNSTNSSPFSV